MQHLLRDKDKAALLQLASETLKSSFNKTEDLVLKKFIESLSQYSASLTKNLPCFVTLLNSELRGCIGSLSSDSPLYENVWEKTQQAAFGDPRFEPVQEFEIPSLHIEISVLAPALPLPSLNDVIIGKHGLVVQSGNHRGVLLAKVASEYGWSPKEFLEQTCLKAGLSPEKAKSYNLSYFEEISF